jgi:dienelactone hydrolase
MRIVPVVWLLAAAAVAEAGLYKPQTGPYALKVVEQYTLTAAARDVPMRVTWPDGQGPFPLLIWCHGALGSSDGYHDLVRHWVSHGYVVIQPTFGDSLQFMDPAERQQFGSAIEAVNSLHVLSQWDKRPREVSMLLDRLEELERAVPALAGVIDRDRIGVGGHSFGAHTAMLLGGVEPRVALRSVSMLDRRVRVVLLVSPSGTTAALPADSFLQLQRPALVVTGDRDGSPVRGQEDKSGQWRRAAFDYAEPGDRYLLWIDGAYHNFGGISGPARWAGAGPLVPEQVQLVTTTCLAMLDAYLQQSEQARDHLTNTREHQHGTATATLWRK